MHDANKVLLGTSVSSIRKLVSFDADPATFKAGYAVRRASDGGLIIADDSTAALYGISAGRDLSNAKYTAVFVAGSRGVPLRLKNAAATLTVGDLTFTSKLFGAAGNAITIALIDSLDDGSASVTVEGTDIVIDIEAAVTTAADIAAAIVGNAEANALVSVEVAEGKGSTAQAAAAEAPLTSGSDVAVKGGVVKIDDVTGEGSVDGDATGAVYASGLMTGVDEDGTEVPVALVDLIGGF